MENTVQERELDFIWRLNDKINSLGLFVWSDVGVLDSKESMALMALPGGAETVYFDGVRDKEYPLQISVKSMNQLNCIDSLFFISKTLEKLEEGEIQSQNNSFDFQSINITSVPSLVTQDEQGFFIYALTFNATITIYQGVVN